MKYFLLKVEVDNEVEFEDLAQEFDCSNLVNDVELVEAYED